MGQMPPALFVISGAFGLLAMVFAVASWRALRRGRVLALGARTFTTLLFATACTLSVLLSAATQGYRAFTQEELAAEVHVEPAGRQAFLARVFLPDGREVLHRLNGDQLYLDAHILKWKPLATFLGLRTAFELDRVAGRYASLEDERTRPRTVYSLAREKRLDLDLFELRRKYGVLGFLVDAEYGSATFTDVSAPAVLEIRVSTSGLLVRPKRAAP
jgi:hypothetical protein